MAHRATGTSILWVYRCTLRREMAYPYSSAKTLQSCSPVSNPQIRLGGSTVVYYIDGLLYDKSSKEIITVSVLKADAGVTF